MLDLTKYGVQPISTKQVAGGIGTSTPTPIAQKPSGLDLSKYGVTPISQTQQTNEQQPGFVQSVVQDIARPFIRTALTGGEILGGGADIVKSLYQKATGRDEEALATLQKSKEIQNKLNTEGVNLGYFGNVKPLGADLGPDPSLGALIKEGTGAGLQMASNIPIAKGAGLTYNTLKTAYKGKALLPTIAKAALPLVAEGATGGGLYGVGAGLEQKQTVPEALWSGVKTAAIGAVSAPVIGLGAPLALGGTRSAITGTKNLFNKELRQSNVINKVSDEIFRVQNNYAKTRRANIVATDSGKMSRDRIAKSNVLANTVNDDGLIITKAKGGAIDKYRAATIDDGEGVVYDMLKKEGSTSEISAVEKKLNQKVNSSYLTRDERAIARNNIRKIVSEFRQDYPNGRIPNSELQLEKINTTKNIDYTNTSSKIRQKAIGNAYKELIEDGSALNIKEVNEKVLAPYYQDIELLANLDGKRVKGGRLGKYFSQISGNIIGGMAGNAVGGPVGSAVGTIIGGELGSRIKGNILARTFSGKANALLPKSKILEKAKGYEKSLPALIPGRDYTPASGGQKYAPIELPAPYSAEAQSKSVGNLNQRYNPTPIINKTDTIQDIIPPTTNKTTLQPKKKDKIVGSKKDFPNYKAPTKWYRGVSQTNQGGDLFFSESKGVAGEFGSVREIRPEELPKNPLIVMGNKEMFVDEIGYQGESPLMERIGKPVNERYDTLIKKYAKDRGHDGIIYTDGTLESQELVKFKDSKPLTPKNQQGKLFGAVAGVEGEYDEDGNLIGVKYNPVKGAIGLGAMGAFQKVQSSGVTTKILEKLKDKGNVSKQFILDMTNMGDVRQPERDLIRKVLGEFDDNAKVNPKEFSDRVKTELLPLERKGELGYYKDEGAPGGFMEGNETRYENIALPEDIRGNVANYKENIYESPIKTSAGNVHFGDATDNYFAHTRIEDMSGNNKTKMLSGPKQGTRRVIEIQSDLFQKGRLELSVRNGMPVDLMTGKKLPVRPEVQKQISQLKPYENTWHERIIREEIKQAAKDGKTKLQFPTGETAMKIEGLGQGESDRWFILSKNDLNDRYSLTPNTLKVGEIVEENLGDRWIITDVLGDGKFKAVPKDEMIDRKTLDSFVKNSETRNNFKEIDGKYYRDHRQETFDISGKVDTSNPIYRFYEKDVQKFLQKFDAKRVVDDNGVSWIEIPVKKEMSTEPVQAFGKIAMEPLIGIAGLTAMGAGLKKGSDYLSEKYPYEVKNEDKPLVPKTKEAEVTMYNPVKGQTDSTPTIMASGKKIYDGAIATNSYQIPLGTLVQFDDDPKTYIVEDRMNRRFEPKLYGKIKFDILNMDATSTGITKAKEFGKKNIKYKIIGHDGRKETKVE